MSNSKAWTVTAPTYSSNVGRTSVLSAARLVAMANDLSPVTAASRILDCGAGTGAVTLTVAEQFPSTSIHATDISATMLESIAPLPNVTKQVLDARFLSQELAEGSFSHVFSTFVLQTITSPLDVVSQMSRVLAPGGVIGIALWARRNGPFEVWERSCQRIDPSYKLPQDPFDDPLAWRTQGELETAFEKVGFTSIRTEEVTMPFPFANEQAFMDFWFNAKNPAAVKCMSNWTSDLDDVKRVMPEVLRHEYASGEDIKTWAVLGVGKKL